MGEKILYENIVGLYVLNESFNIIESREGEVKGFDKIKSELNKKYPKMRAPTPLERLRITEFFSNKNYLQKLKAANMKITACQIKDSVSEDQLIIQSARLSEELEKQISTLSKRLREWSENFYPRTSEGISDNIGFARAISQGKTRPEDLGAKPAAKDIKMLLILTKEILDIFNLKEASEKYYEEKLKKRAPNFHAVAGSKIGSKLLIHAGSVEKLSKMPASTIQLLGAEQALFRHLRNKNSKPPKYGIIHEHPLVLKAKATIRGKVARMLADKISIALKVDFFEGKFVGDKLIKEVEKRFKE